MRGIRKPLTFVLIGAWLLTTVLPFGPSTAQAADITVTAASVLGAANQQISDETAGATITAGQVVYRDSTSSNQVKPAQATTLAKAALRGIALNNAAAGQPVKVQTGGDINPGGTVVVGQIYVVAADAAGGIAPYADLASTNYVTIVGIGTTATNITLSIKAGGIAKP